MLWREGTERADQGSNNAILQLNQLKVMHRLKVNNKMSPLVC